MSNGAAQVEHASCQMAKVVAEIVRSVQFNKDEILQEQLTLSQAFCLLWQDSNSGEVKWRKTGIETNAGAAAAVAVDLIVQGKAEVEVVPNTTMGIRNDKILLKVINDCPTDTYLDRAMFNDILQRHRKKPDNPDLVKNWIRSDLWKMQARKRCSTITLDSLVEMGVFKKEDKLFGVKYPTLQQGPQEKLRQEIRAVALEDQEPSSYIRVLLCLARATDNLLVLCDPILQKHFSKEEHTRAKERIKQMAGIGNSDYSALP